jgi:hypothetical protein
LHPENSAEIELQHAANNQPGNQSASLENETTTAGMPQRKQATGSFKPMHCIRGIKHAGDRRDSDDL